MKEKFEELLKELEEIIKKLEEGNLDLDESIAKYQRGIELAKKCKKQLQDAKEIVVNKMSEKDQDGK
ncbi:MAG: exodeoxyribonuclease VII small subunit [Bacilli bacterium]|nr:exodeoxyribonuclease VII small subunit [Bacilli bacterium]